MAEYLQSDPYNVPDDVLRPIIASKDSTALERLKKNPWEGEDINKELNFISNKLGIKTEELKSYLKIPLKTYKDYKSQKWIYFLGSKVMKFFKLEIGGKR